MRCVVTINEVLAMIGELCGMRKHTGADTTRAAKALGYRPTVDQKAGLAAEIEWMRSLLSQQ